MSPTVISERGFRVMIYLNDHKPAHVHVKKAENEARIGLDPVKIIDHTGFSPSQLSDIIELVTEHQATRLAKWNEIHAE